MILLHAAARDGGFWVWAEASGGEESPKAPKVGRRVRSPSDAQLPSDAGIEGLSAALESAGLDARVPTAFFERMTVWLPSASGLPIPSSPLIAERPGIKGQPVLAPWLVTAYRLDIAQAVQLLSAVVGKPVLAPGILVGRDLAFWTLALRLAGGLVARQSFLPGLLPKEDTWCARWEPILEAAEARRVAELSEQMPASARAMSADTAAEPPSLPAASVLTDFLSAVVDYLVRSAAAIEAAPNRTVGRRKPASFASLHEHWLHALRSDDGLMDGNPAELRQFAEQIRQWRRPVSVSTSAPVRLCFRLDEPPSQEEHREEEAEGPLAGIASRLSNRNGWQVRYLLQAIDDPSLLMPAEEAWKAKGRRGSLANRSEFNLQEYLISGLGQAAGICPRIEASLKTSRPGGYATDATGAHEFLTEKAMALEQAGFGVMLPAWWTRKGTKLRLSLRASVKSPAMQGANALSMDELVKFDWEVALGDHKLSFAELEMLARLKEPLVKVRGQWVQMSADEIQEALDYWRKKGSRTATVRDVVKMALGADGKQGGLALRGVEADGWIGQLLGQLQGQAESAELPPPETFQGVLRPYQVRGYSWLAFLRRWGLGACLADDMGLGKTIQTLALIQRDWHAGSRRPVLLICPTSVVGNWQKEAARFTPELPVLVHHGLGRARKGALAAAAPKQAVVISSYSLLHRDLEAFREVSWEGVILDEAQNIKNPQTKQAQAARSLQADFHVALTGTPVENHVGDLWSIMEFLNPGLLGTQAQFKRNYYLPIQASRDPEAAARLKQVTGPFILRRLKTDRSIIADLPEKMEMKVFCTLTKEQASLYSAVLKDAERGMKDSEGIQRKGLILGMLSKLKQVCNHPAQFLGDNSSVPGRSGKLARLTEMLEELIEVGDRALLFTQFTEMGQILQRYLEETFGREVLFLHGGVTKRNRDGMVERFQSEGGPPVFLLSLKAGGTGLNLTRANHVFHFDRWWNPAVENQATDRAFRIGQTKNVQVHKFLCVGTFEEKIDEMIESKKAVAEQVVGAGEGWLTELSDRELKRVFALGKEAVGE